MQKLLIFVSFIIFGISECQIIIEDPIIDVGNSWSHHQIESFHFTSHGGFLFLNNGSSWKINPSELENVREKSAFLMNTPLTIMPEAGSENYPIRVIVHDDKEMGWTNFTVQYLSAPNDNEATLIAEVDQRIGNTLILSIPMESTTMRLPLLVNPHDKLTLKNWKKGQKVIIGGVWLPEYDFNEPKDYNSAYQYVLFNYVRENYVFFTVLPEDTE